MDASESFLAIVGPAKKQYILVTSLATKHSKFFASALKKHWQEGIEKSVQLPDIRAIAFDFYVHWLYTGKIPIHDLEHLKRIPAGTVPFSRSALLRQHNYAREVYTRLIGLCVPADYLADVAFQNEIMTIVYATWTDKGFFPMLSTVQPWWDKMPDGCMLKKLVGKYWAAQDFMKTITSKDAKDVTMPFALLVIAEGLGESGDPVVQPDQNKPCEFHEHGEGNSPCEAGLRAEIRTMLTSQLEASRCASEV